jgi:hypothetical protein
MLISNHVLRLSPLIRKSQTMDSRIGYRAAARIGLLEWHARFMLPFNTEVGVSDGEPFPACLSGHAGNGEPGPLAWPASVLAGISATLPA